MKLVLPTSPGYMNDLGQPIYLLQATSLGKRPAGVAPRFLILHHTAGRDSREYLWDNELGVSTHYLIGTYPDTALMPRIYKFGSETNDVAYTQAFSSIGLLRDPNNFCISIELEGPPIAPAVIETGATLAASIISYWSARDVDLVLLRHRDIDRQNKIDPTLGWTAFCREVYRQVI